ncbi:MAG TPA: hypothetical protein VKW06_17420 [Candidatus Angelobacter sp.]|nr:hypothetical protein [Candidatus Angelobacter sp.]
MEFFKKSAEVYDAYTLEVLTAYYRANSQLEEGIVAELGGKPAPMRFRASLRSFEAMAQDMTKLEKKMTELIEIDKRAADQKVPIYEETVKKVLAESRPFERISVNGVRYGNAGGVEGAAPAAVQSTSQILVAQRDDLQVLEKKLAEVIEAMRNAIPLAEKGEFARVMLSGRNAFGSKMPQFTDMMSAYDRFVVRSCMTTIDATMQVYPKGWEWLQPAATPEK